MSASSARKLAGAGGFINISQNAKRVVFVGTFTAGGLEVAVGDGKLADRQRKARRASSSRMSSIAPSAANSPPHAASPCSTSPSAACFASAPRASNCIEIAPGIDLERDILAQMDFEPIMRGEPKLDGRAHLHGRANGLARRSAQPAAGAALHLDEDKHVFFVNLERFSLRSVAGDRANPADRRGTARPARAQGLGHRQLRQFRHSAGTARSLFGHGAGPDRRTSTPMSRAIRPAASCA